jgi:hypothetical protein
MSKPPRDVKTGNTVLCDVSFCKECGRVHIINWHVPLSDRDFVEHRDMERLRKYRVGDANVSVLVVDPAQSHEPLAPGRRLYTDLRLSVLAENLRHGKIGVTGCAPKLTTVAVIVWILVDEVLMEV